MLVMGAGGGLVGRGHTGGDQSCQPTFAKFHSARKMSPLGPHQVVLPVGSTLSVKVLVTFNKEKALAPIIGAFSTGTVKLHEGSLTALALGRSQVHGNVT